MYNKNNMKNRNKKRNKSNLPQISVEKEMPSFTELTEHINDETLKIVLRQNEKIIAEETYIIKGKYDHEKRQLETQIDTLTKQIDENIKLRKELESILVERSDEIKKSIDDNNKLTHKVEELNTTIEMLRNGMLLLTKENIDSKDNNKKLERQIEILIKENVELKNNNKNLERQIETLRKENIELKNNNKKLTRDIEDMKHRNMIDDVYKKFSDNAHNVIANLRCDMCVVGTDIYEMSKDNSVYCLSSHLKEIHCGNHRTRVIIKNVEHWKKIYEIVKQLLEREYKTTIDIFFELTELVNDRNGMSHNHESITKEELSLITEHCDELLKLINSP
jgi:F0F1-type ATP synthase membrane subunit b/b'